MLHITFFIHGNLQYGEFPESEAPEILQRSYLPTLEYFADVPLSPRSPGTKDLALLDLLHPVIALGANGSQLAVIPFHRDLIDHIFDYSNGNILFNEIAELLAALDGAYCQTTPGLLIFGPSDAEFIGYYGYQNRTPIDFAKMGELMQRLAELSFVQVSLPYQYLVAHPPTRKVYVPAGSSEPSFDIWTSDPDNQRLNDLCAEAGRKLLLAETLLGLQPGRVQGKIEQAWRAMLLSENSDGRGWMPHPERRLFCYNQALLAIQLADEILNHE